MSHQRVCSLMLFLDIIVMLTTASWADFVNLRVFSIGGVNVFPIDLLLPMMVVYLARGESPDRLWPHVPKLFVWFMCWFLFSIVRGAFSYGISAYGDTRNVSAILFFLVSFAIALRCRTVDEGRVIFERVLLVAGITVLVMTLLELAVGHRVGIFYSTSENEAFRELSDARGIRILGTDQTFWAGLVALYPLVAKMRRVSVDRAFVYLSPLLLMAVLISRNRTATFSLAFALAVFLLTFGSWRAKAKALMYVILSAVVVITLLNWLRPDFLSADAELLKAGLNPEEDPTGTWEWRLVIAASAFEQFLQHPIAGEGYGGHWGLLYGDTVVTDPPHNQYLSFLVKMGAVGLALFVALLVRTAVEYYRHHKRIPQRTLPIFDLVFVAVVACIPYGFAYDYPPMFGFLLGAFYGLLLKALAQERSIRGEALAQA